MLFLSALPVPSSSHLLSSFHPPPHILRRRSHLQMFRPSGCGSGLS
nr:MAG TPA: hypothetical protein [Caudoviricetes sp.]